MNTNLKNVVLDTSVLMDNHKILDKFIDTYLITINIVTLEELNRIKDDKKDIDRSQSARRAINKINEYIDIINFDSKIYTVSGLSSKCNDNSIIGCALENDAYLYTNDIGMKIKARTLSITTISATAEDEQYKGYIRYEFTTDEYNDYWDNRFDYFKSYYINQYILIKSLDDNKESEFRYDGNDLVQLVLPDSSVIKGKNGLQRCVLDMLNNRDIEVCAVMGMVGSGKTYLSLRMALECLNKHKNPQSKILGVREPTGEGERIGYLKGDFDDKTYKFFKPLVQCLDGGEFEFNRMVSNDELEVEIPFYLKGTTYDNTIIVADESEDLSDKQIRLIGTRLGQNSRIFFSGDYIQSIKNVTLTNPLVKMCEKFKGNKRFACIYLEEDVRSEASRMFADLLN